MVKNPRKKIFYIIIIFVALFFVISCACPPDVIRDSPASRITLSSNYFNPNVRNLTISLPSLHRSRIASWEVEILEPQPPHLVFHKWVGEGPPPPRLIWDGKNSEGEWVHSASDYPLIYSTSDIDGNTRTIESKITVDVFVIQEEYGLRMIIPSIVFAANSGTWEGLDTETIANNEWILSRIALTLNKHRKYKVRVEGHANPTVNPNDTAGRTREQTQELQPLSQIRAGTIVNELVKLGIESSRLSYYGIGGEHPVAAWTDHDSWWKNRRVEFILTE